MGFLSEVPMGNEFAPFVAFQQARGFIPNLLQAQSLLPRVIKAQTILENAVLGGGTISQIQKERILLSIAAHRQDAYCIAAHSKALCSLGAADNHIDDLLSDYRNANLSLPI